jgi:uncharacterized membrane protein HdeD (DUF308 family)
LISLAQILVLITGITLVIGGISKKEKYTANKNLQKRMLIYGLILIILTLFISLPEMYTGFISGWNAAN